MIIAIDGPSGAGKGTLGKALAEKYQMAYLDTGLLYRILAHKIQEAGIAVDDRDAVSRMAKKITFSDFDNPNLRTEEIGSIASIISTYSGVRSALLTWKRKFVEDLPATYTGAVVDGRDIGTVVFPHAEVKLFITASAEARANRRVKQLQEAGKEADFDTIFKAIQERDFRDVNRADSPLIPASNATIIETTDLSVDEVFAVACSEVNKHSDSDK